VAGPGQETDDGAGQVSDSIGLLGQSYSCGHSAGFQPASFFAGARERRTLFLARGLSRRVKPCQARAYALGAPDTCCGWSETSR